MKRFVPHQSSRSALGIVGALLGLLGCGMKGSAPAPASIEEYFSTLGSLGAAQLTCTLMIPEKYSGAFASGVQLEDAADSLGQARLAIAGGRQSFDGSKARKCLTALALDPGTCWSTNVAPSHPLLNASDFLLNLFEARQFQFPSAPTACDSVFVGLVAPGGTCYRDGDCLAGGTCAHDNNACPGTCLAGTTEGGSCKTTACGGGLLCDTSELVCRSPQAAGAPCKAGCGEGLVCDWNGVCAPPATITGTPCTYDNQCADSLFCAEPAPNDPGFTCRPRVGPGQPCVKGSGVGPAHECVGNQACVAKDTSGAGHCGGLSDVGGHCTPSSQAANNIGSNVGCLNYLSCDAASATCVVPPGVGQRCTNACDPITAWCSSGVCVAQIDDGKACSQSTECHPGSYCGFSPHPQVCAPSNAYAFSCPEQ